MEKLISLSVQRENVEYFLVRELVGRLSKMATQPHVSPRQASQSLRVAQPIAYMDYNTIAVSF
jgi:hypothetical protein